MAGFRRNAGIFEIRRHQLFAHPSRQYFNYRDIIARYNIRKHTTLKELMHLLTAVYQLKKPMLL